MATDFSRAGLAALPYAYGIVARGGTVHLLHVIDVRGEPNPLYAHYTPGRAPTPAQRKRQAAELRRKLRALAPPGARRRGIATEVAVEEGPDVVARVCRAADRLGADAICVGSHGRTGLARRLFGSVAEGILRRAHQPVWVVRSRERR
jgi:nucleotide-binding universal stress UspA family protein